MKLFKHLEKVYLENFLNSFNSFKKEFLNTESEIFWCDGERTLSKKEQKYIKIIDPLYDS